MTEPRNDFDVRVPPWLQHTWPVWVALLMVLITLSDNSVYDGLSEGETATRFNVFQITAAIGLCFAAARNHAVQRSVRQAAWLLGGISTFALVDEVWSFHEEIGYWVQDTFTALPKRVTFYTDDALILGGALVGTVLLTKLIRRSGHARELVPYVASFAALAIAHGVLDFLSHGIGAVSVMFPDAPRVELKSMEDRLTVFEEFAKIWAVWFFILFMQRFAYRDRVPLAWPWMLCLGSGVAAVSLWQVADPGLGIPYLKLGGSLRFIRNFHGYSELAIAWVALATAAWIALRQRPDARAWLGALFPVTAAAAAGGWSNPERAGAWFAAVADGLLPNAYWGADFWSYSLFALLLLLPGLLLGLLMVAGVRRGLAGLGGALLVAAALALLLPARAGFVPALALAAGSVALALADRVERAVPARRRGLALAAVVLVSALALGLTLDTLMPNSRFRDRDFVFFRMRYQPFPPAELP